MTARRRASFFLKAVLFLSLTAVATDAGAEGSRLYDIGIYVIDLDRTAEFYSKVFGFEVKMRWEGMTNVSEDGKEAWAPLAGMYMTDSIGTNFEFLERGVPDARQEVQEPLNHFATRPGSSTTTFIPSIPLAASCCCGTVSRQPSSWREACIPWLPGTHCGKEDRSCISVPPSAIRRSARQ